eukprot:13218836-Alexandrium_andersonii.AAC.1
MLVLRCPGFSSLWKAFKIQRHVWPFPNQKTAQITEHALRAIPGPIRALRAEFMARKFGKWSGRGFGQNLQGT